MPAIDLRLLPHLAPMSSVKFQEEHPPFSIAIDGFVMERSGWVMTSEGPYAWLDHHQRQEARLDLRATCAQVFLWLKMGLLEPFKQQGKLRLNVYAHDADQDVALAWFLLSNYKLVIGGRHKRLERMVELVDRLDTTAGTYPVTREDLSTLEQMAWVFEPYTDRRVNGKIVKLGLDEAYKIVFAVEKRIQAYLDKEAKRIKLDLDYEEIGGGVGWKMIRELGAQGRQGAIMDGVKAYASHLGTFQLENSSIIRHRWVIGRLSDMIAFPVPELWDYLNKLEECPAEDHWGESSMVGGSPRSRGSLLGPKELQKAINGFLKQKEKSNKLAR